MAKVLNAGALCVNSRGPVTQPNRGFSPHDMDQDRPQLDRRPDQTRNIVCCTYDLGSGRCPLGHMN